MSDGALGEPGTELGPLPQLSRSVELLKLVQAGDRGACNELLERYRPRLLRIVRVKLGAGLRRRIDDEDIVQETLLIAAARLPHFELRTHAGILNWFARVAENVIRRRHEFHEAEKRRAGSEVDAAAGTSASRARLEPVAEGSSPSQKASRAELEALVDAHVRALEPPEYRAVILHRDYLQEEWEEVRSALARPTVAAAQELYRRAHRRLREGLQKHIDPG